MLQTSKGSLLHGPGAKEASQTGKEVSNGVQRKGWHGRRGETREEEAPGVEGRLWGIVME